MKQGIVSYQTPPCHEQSTEHTLYTTLECTDASGQDLGAVSSPTGLETGLSGQSVPVVSSKDGP